VKISSPEFTTQEAKLSLPAEKAMRPKARSFDKEKKNKKTAYII